MVFIILALPVVVLAHEDGTPAIGAPTATEGPGDAGPRPEIVLQIGHVNAVTALAYSPDGMWVASGSKDRTAKIWDARTGTLLWTLTGHRDSVLAVAFSKDGRRLVTVSRDGVVKLWDAQAGALLGTLTGPKPTAAAADGASTAAGAPAAAPVPGSPVRFTAVALSPDGANGDGTLEVAAANPDRSITLWRAPGTPSGRPEVVAALTGNGKAVRALAFSSDGKLLASGGDDGIVQLWDAGDGSLQRSLQGHAMPILGVAFSRDGRTLADASEDGIARLWDTGTGKPGQQLQQNRPGDGVAAVAFSPAGAVATGGHGGVRRNEYIKLWNEASGAETRTLLGHEAYVTAVAFSPDGRQLVSGSRDDTVRLWDVQSGRQVQAGGATDYLTSVAFSPGGDLLASGGADSAVRLWDVRTGAMRRVLSGHAGAVRSVAFSPDGKWLASGGQDRTIRIWDAGTGDAVRAIGDVDGPVNGVAFSPDSKTVAAGTGESTTDGAAVIWDVATGKKVRTLSGQSLAAVHSVAFSPDGKLLATGSGVRTAGEVVVWDAQTGEKLSRAFLREVRAVAFSTDGKLLAGGSATLTEQGDPTGDEVRIWNGRTQALQRTMAAPGEEAWIDALAFAPDGKTVAAGNRDERVKLWNARTGEALGTLVGHAGGVLSVAFAPDGTRIASAGLDNTVRIWTAGGALLATLIPLPAYPGGAPALAGGPGTSTAGGPGVSAGGPVAASSDWLAVTPEGYYDGSAAAGRFIQWRVGPDLFPVEAFERTFHRPDLMKKALQDPSAADTPAARRFLAGQAIPPQVRFLAPAEGSPVSGDRLKVEVEVTDDREVSGVEVLANGRAVAAKPIQVGSKPIAVGSKPIAVGSKPIEIGSTGLNAPSGSVDSGAKAIAVGSKPIAVGSKPVPAGHRIAQEFEIDAPIPPGETRITLTAVARDADDLEARSDLHLTRGPASGPEGDLYVLSVGISRYANPQYNLKYAALDADAFADLWQRKGPALYGHVEVTKLEDAAATAAGVRAALFKLLEGVTERDSVVVFLSGHGVQVDSGDYYSATHEIDASTAAKVAETALPWTALQTTLSSLRAKRVFMFLDACHSGNALGDQQAYNERMAELLAKRAGVMVFSSSRGTEYSYELDSARHGAFTAALEEGLDEGKADLEIGGSRDGVITAEELLASLRARVPQLTQNRQTPSCPLLRDFGEAYPLLKVETRGAPSGR